MQILTYGPKASPWTPTNIASLKLWLDFSDSTTLYVDAGSTNVSSDGDQIYQANDKSGNSANFTQTTQQDRMTYKTSIQNSLSAALLDGNGDCIKRAITLSDFVGNNTATVFAVIYQDSSQANNGLYGCLAPDATNIFGCYATYSNVIYFDYGNTSSGGRIFENHRFESCLNHANILQ